MGHSLIHLGYAFELGSKELGMEALAMFATNYGLHEYISVEFPTADCSVLAPPAAQVTEDPLEIIHRIRMDPAFDGIFSHPGADNIAPLLELREKEVLYYYRQFKITSPADAHKSLNRVATLLLACSHGPGRPEFDSFRRSLDYCFLRDSYLAARGAGGACSAAGQNALVVRHHSLHNSIEEGGASRVTR